MFNPKEYLLKVYGSIYLFLFFWAFASMICIGLISDLMWAGVLSVVVSIALYFFFRTRYMFYEDRIVITNRFRKDLVILHRRIEEVKFIEYRRTTFIGIKHLYKGKEKATNMDVGYDGPSVRGLLLRQGLNVIDSSIF